MDKRTLRRGLINAIWVAAFCGLYLLLNRRGLFPQHRRVAFAFAVVAAIVAFTRYWREEGDVVVSAIFLASGCLALRSLFRHGDLTEGLMASIFLSIGLKEVYLLVQSRRRKIPTPNVSSQQPKLNHA